MQSLIRNSALHNSDCLCPNTIIIVVIPHTDVTPKTKDNFDVGTQIVLDVNRSKKIVEVEAARFLNALIPRVNRKLV